jgi:hypothetical protein
MPRASVTVPASQRRARTVTENSTRKALIAGDSAWMSPLSRSRAAICRIDEFLVEEAPDDLAQGRKATGTGIKDGYAFRRRFRIGLRLVRSAGSYWLVSRGAGGPAGTPLGSMIAKGRYTLIWRETLRQLGIEELVTYPFTCAQLHWP